MRAVCALVVRGEPRSRSKGFDSRVAVNCGVLLQCVVAVCRNIGGVWPLCVAVTCGVLLQCVVAACCEMKGF